MTLATLFVHVGTRKAGSTFLQEEFFPSHPQIHSLGKPFTDDGIIDFVTHLFAEDMAFDLGRARRQVADSVRPAMRDGMANILSSEDFAVPPNFRDQIVADRGIMMRRLIDLFGDVKVIFVLRNQTTVLRSVYSDYLKDSFHRQYKYMTYDDWVARAVRRRAVQAHMYKYAAPLAYYERLLGRDNVGVFLYETLSTDRAAFVRDVSRFMNVDPDLFQAERKPADGAPRANARLSRAQWLGVRIGHLMGGRDVRRFVPPGIKALLKTVLDRGTGDMFALSMDNERALQDLYAADNRHVQELWGLALSSHDYPM